MGFNGGFQPYASHDIYHASVTVGVCTSESELLLVTRPNDNHSPGPVIKEVSP